MKVVCVHSDEPMALEAWRAALLRANDRLPMTAEFFILATDATDASVIIFDCGPNIIDLSKLAEVVATKVPVVLWERGAPLEFLRQAISLGVRGVLSKLQPVETQVQVIETVLKGEMCIERFLAAELLAQRVVRLTKREGQIVHAIMQGLTTKQMAVTLGLSPGTIKVYLSRLFEKLNVGSRVQLAIWGRQNFGQLTGDPGKSPVRHMVLAGHQPVTEIARTA